MATYEGAAEGWTPKRGKEGDTIKYQDGTERTITKKDIESRPRIYEDAAPGWTPKQGRVGDVIKYSDGTAAQITSITSTRKNTLDKVGETPFGVPIYNQSLARKNSSTSTAMVETRQNTPISSTPANRTKTEQEIYDLLQKDRDLQEFNEYYYGKVGLSGLLPKEGDSGFTSFGKSLGMGAITVIPGVNLVQLAPMGFSLAQSARKATFQTKMRIFGDKEQREEAKFFKQSYQWDAAFGAVTPFKRSESGVVSWSPEGTATVLTVGLSTVGVGAAVGAYKGWPQSFPSTSGSFKGEYGSARSTLATKPGDMSSNAIIPVGTTNKPVFTMTGTEPLTGIKGFLGGKVNTMYKKLGTGEEFLVRRYNGKTQVTRQSPGDTEASVSFYRSGKLIEQKNVPRMQSEKLSMDIMGEAAPPRYSMTQGTGNPSTIWQGVERKQLFTMNERIGAAKYRGSMEYTSKDTKTTSVFGNVKGWFTTKVIGGDEINFNFIDKKVDLKVGKTGVTNENVVSSYRRIPAMRDQVVVEMEMQGFAKIPPVYTEVSRNSVITGKIQIKQMSKWIPRGKRATSSMFSELERQNPTKSTYTIEIEKLSGFGKIPDDISIPRMGSNTGARIKPSFRFVASQGYAINSLYSYAGKSKNTNKENQGQINIPDVTVIPEQRSTQKQASLYFIGTPQQTSTRTTQDIAPIYPPNEPPTTSFTPPTGFNIPFFAPPIIPDLPGGSSPRKRSKKSKGKRKYRPTSDLFNFAFGTRLGVRQRGGRSEITGLLPRFI